MRNVAHKYSNARVTASSAERDWPGLLAELLEHPVGRVGPFESGMTTPAGIRPFETVATELTIVLEGCGSVSRQLDGALPQTIDAVPGTMWLTPARSREDFIDFEDAIPQALHIYLTPDRFGFAGPGVRQRTTAVPALRRDAPFHDSLVEEIARAVSAELQAPTGGSSTLIAPLGLCLAARLLHAHTDACRGSTPPPHAWRLDTRRFEKVSEHVTANLERQLSVTELASVAFLSPSRFAHAFKVSTGESPQRYVSAQRLERAKALLCEGLLPLAGVSDSCGFASQASFTKAFVRATGQTPGRYRQQSTARKAGRWGEEQPAVIEARASAVATEDRDG